MDEPVLVVFENIYKLLCVGLYPGDLSEVLWQAKSFLAEMIRAEKAKAGLTPDPDPEGRVQHA